MAHIEFRDFFFEFFFEDISEITLLEYLSIFYRTFFEYYKELPFNEFQLKSTFTNILQTQNIRTTFDFRLKNNGIEESWKLKIYNTKICRFVGGFNVTSESSIADTTYIMTFAELLIARNLVDVAYIEKQHHIKRSYILFDRLIKVNKLELYGKTTGIYLNRKFFAMKSLYQAMHWEKYSSMSKNFCELIKFIKASSLNQNHQQIISICSEKKTVQLFLQQQDQKLLAQENKEYFIELLASVNLSLKEWLNK